MKAIQRVGFTGIRSNGQGCHFWVAYGCVGRENLSESLLRAIGGSYKQKFIIYLLSSLSGYVMELETKGCGFHILEHRTKATEMHV